MELTPLLEPVLAFLTYFTLALGLLTAFIVIYLFVTPYRELSLIRENNEAAAITLGGAVMGFTLPLASAIYYTMSLAEMLVWASITCIVQLLVFTALRRLAARIAEGQVASARLLASVSIAVGILNAVSISH